MPYKTGEWGPQQKERSKRRLAYFREYQRDHAPPRKVFRLGEFGELMANRKLNGSKRDNQTSHDLIWNDQRIEVKTSETVVNGRFCQFDIRIQKREGQTDYFFILILDELTRELRHAYLIPDKEIAAKITLTIRPGGRSKYERWRLQLRNYERVH